MSGQQYGCHCDIENTVDGKPDGCVFDNGDIEDCVYATKLHRENSGKAQCKYWQPVVVVAEPANADEIIASLRQSRDELLEALKEIEAIEDREWKPMQVFRSDEQVARDEARHDLACEIAGIARAAIKHATEGAGDNLTGGQA
jgi:hypothetical protein